MHDFLDKLWSMEFGSALLGAVAGGAFSILGAWWQSRSSNKAAARVQAQGYALRAFDTITLLRTHLEAQTFQGRGTAETRAAWNLELRTQFVTAKGAIMLLPDEYEETRKSARAALDMITNFNGLFGWAEYKVATRLLLTEAIKHLGLFVRGSEAPETRDMDAVLTAAIDDYNRERAQKELDSLNAEAERGELDEVDKGEARKIREYLGIPHPVQPSPDEPEVAS
ncbi:hypothetical protein ACFWP7_04900 [Streptomyces sp. NPDC058470]|uniref:hypothetical protein n=1 Tax=Streptomyces sp. NPDC058470 TaxID=3346515 RepID=UPI0036556977